MLSGLVLHDWRYHVLKNSPNASIFLSKFPDFESESETEYSYPKQYSRSDEMRAISESLQKPMPDNNPAQNLGWRIHQLYLQRDQIQDEINQHKYHCDNYPDHLDEALERNFDLLAEAEKQMESLKDGSWKRDPETCEWVFTNV